jgi:cardiolipin synthase
MPLLTRLKLKTRAYKRFLEDYVDSPIRSGNTVEALTNGDEIFPAMLSAIASAKQSIALLTYVYWRGEIATQFAEALAEKARSGARVAVEMDAFGSSKIDGKLIKMMQQAGVEFRWFRPVKWYTLHKLNNRTHRKILVVDQHIGFIGGVGIAEEWTGNAQDVHHWRDTHFRVTGPAVSDLIASFNDNWTEAGGTALDTTYQPTSDSTGALTVQVTSSKATNGRTHADKLFMSLIRSAQLSINITTAYFAPSAQFCTALIAARATGVKVVILTNGPHTNHTLTRRAGHRYYKQLLAAGVEIYEYQQTLIHTKVVTIDGTWASVGSINFDDRSFVLNDEINLSTTDSALVTKLDVQLAKDLAASKRMVLYKWIKRPLNDRFIEFVGSIFRPQL